jgi:hypothetical protein
VGTQWVLSLEEIAMKLIGKSLGLGLVAATSVVAACSSSHPGTTGAGVTNPGPADGIGAAGVALTLPGGEHFSTLTYDLNLPGGHDYPGSYNITNTSTVSFVIGSVAAGTGYGLSLSTKSDDGRYICSYPAQGAAVTFNINVANRTTTVVNVNMQCVDTQGLDAGSVLVNAMTSNCPNWNTIVGNPENITLDAGGANVNAGNPEQAGSTAFMGGLPTTAVINDGNQLVLVGSATAPNPGALTFAWSVSGTGTLPTLTSPTGSTDPNSTDAGITNQTIFTCPPAPNPTTTYTVALDVNDGADAANCDPVRTHGTIQVQCVNPAACGGNPTSPTATGACTLNGMPAGNDSKGYPWVATSTQDPSGVFCCAGACGDTGQISSTFPTGTCPSGLPAGVPASGSLNVNGCCKSLAPCLSAADVTAGQCVKCQGNTSGICTQTEAAFVQLDINKGTANAPGNDPAAGCYTCLYGATCLDSTVASLSGSECGDLTATSFTAGNAHAAGSNAAVQALCLDTLYCTLDIATSSYTPAGVGSYNYANGAFSGGTGSPAVAGGCGAQTALGGLDYCYCGPGGGLPSACSASTSGQNGICLTAQTNGFTYAPTDGHSITGNFGLTSQPSGMANSIFGCALTNSCTQCLQ